jgi:hypothetical protein
VVGDDVVAVGIERRGVIEPAGRVALSNLGVAPDDVVAANSNHVLIDILAADENSSTRSGLAGDRQIRIADVQVRDQLDGSSDAKDASARARGLSAGAEASRT